jgi:hypothetical protein
MTAIPVQRGDGVGPKGPIEAHPLFQGEGSGAVPTSPLQFTIRKIDMWTAAELNRQWHSMLPRTDIGNLLCGNMSMAFAAEFGGKYYAVAIWSQPIIYAVAKDGKTIELRRLAICDKAPKNTASRMLCVMQRMIAKEMPHIRRLVSYQAIDVHKGTIYRAAGWKPVGDVSDARPQRLAGSAQRSTGPLQTVSPKQRWEKRQRK